MPSASLGHNVARLAQVLEYMDGPQVVLLDKADDRRIIAVAIDDPERVYPFFGADISLNQWERYRRGLVDLRFLLIYPRWKRWYLFDLAEVKNRQVHLTRVEKDAFADAHYVPDAGFFSYHHSEPINTSQWEGLSVKRYLTDGIWDLPDFTEFYHRISDIYVFHLSLKKYQSPSTPLDQKRSIRYAFSEHPLRGGSSYVRLYADLANTQRLDERLSVDKIKYASAGRVDIRGRPDIFSAMSEPLEEFGENYESLKNQYRTLYRYLQKNKYLRARADSIERDSELARYLRAETDKLARDLQIEDPGLIYELTGEYALQYAKVILAHFRRVESYFMFFAEGRAKETEGVLEEE